MTYVMGDVQNGHFEMKVGMSYFWTYGQTMRVHVEKAEHDSAKIPIYCEAPHVTMDRARNQNKPHRKSDLLEVVS